MAPGRSRLAIAVGVVVLVLAIVSFFTPWYHLKQDLPLGLTSERQFALDEQVSIISGAGDSSSLEYTTHSSYDNPPDFLKVGDLMQIQTLLLIAALIIQGLFVMTVFAGARRMSLVLGALSLVLILGCWVMFLSSVDDAVNSSSWASQPGQEPISGFTGSRDFDFLGTIYTTSWGPMFGWFLLIVAFGLQLVAVVRLAFKHEPLASCAPVQHNA